MPYDIAGALQNPNIIQNALMAGQQGRLAGLQDQAVQKQNALAGLASQAYTTPTEGRNGLLQQMAAIDPDSASKQAQAFATMDEQKKAQVAAGLDQFAHTAASIAQDPDEQRATAAYGALIDRLASTGKDVSQFRNVPPKVGAQMALVQIASTKDLLAASGIGADVGTVVAPGGALVNKATGAPMFRNPAALQYHDVPMGEGRAAGTFDPGTGMVRPAVGGAPPQATDPAQAIIAKANEEARAGVPQAEVESRMQQRMQAAGLQPQPAGGNQLQTSQAVAPAQFGVGVPKASANDSIIRKRTQEIADLERSGVKLTDTQRQNYLTTGKPGEDSGATMQDPLAGLSPSDQALVRSLASYRTLPSSLGRSNNRAELLARAAMLNPDYNEAGAKQAYTYLTDLGKNGPTSAGGAVQSINTGLNHLGTLMRANKELAGTSFPALNAVGNFFSTETGGTGATNWKQATYLFSQEMAKLVKGGVANEGEVRDIVDQLSASKSPEQRAQAIQQAAEFMYGRIQAVEDRGRSVLGDMAPDTSLMTPEAQANLKQAYQLGGRDLPDLPPASDGASYIKQVGKKIQQTATPQSNDFSHLWGG